MASAASEARPSWRPRTRLWLLFGLFIAGSVLLSAISAWRDDHLLLINTTGSLPNWAFLIQRHKLPARGDYVFFDPPPSTLLRRHFGAKPRMFGKIVYGMPGDTISQAAPCAIASLLAATLLTTALYLARKHRADTAFLEPAGEDQ